MSEAKVSKNQLRLAEILNSAERKSYFVIAVTTVFVVVLVLFGVLPSYSAFTKQGADNVKRSEIIAKIDKKKLDLSALSKEYDKSTNLINLFGSAFPDKPSQDDIFEELNSLIQSNKLDLRSMNFTEDQNIEKLSTKFGLDQSVKSISINLVIESKDSSYINFIKDIENLKRFYLINSMVLSRSASQTSQENYQISVQMQYFYYLQS